MPAGVFSILEVMPVNEEAQQYASILFSDPISIAQDLTGLISLSEQSDISYQYQRQRGKGFYQCATRWKLYPEH